MTYLIVSKERRDSPFFLSKDVIKFEGKWFFSEKAKEGRKEGKLKPRITIKDRSRREGKERTNETIEATSSLSKKKMQIKNSYSLNTEEIFERVSRVISHSVSFLEIPPRTARFRWHKCRAKCSFRLFVGQSASRTSTIERSVKRSARNNRVRRTRKFWPFPLLLPLASLRDTISRSNCANSAATRIKVYRKFRKWSWERKSLTEDRCSEMNRFRLIVGTDDARCDDFLTVRRYNLTSHGWYRSQRDWTLLRFRNGDTIQLVALYF